MFDNGLAIRAVGVSLLPLVAVVSGGTAHRNPAGGVSTMIDPTNSLKPTVFIGTVPSLRHLVARYGAPAHPRAIPHPHRQGRPRRRRWVSAWEHLVPGPKHLWRAALILAVPIVLIGCASKKVLVPPRLDLTEHGRVGLVTFTIENAKGDLNGFATERFLQDVFAGQQGIEVLELGDAEALLAEVGESELGPRAIQRIGDAYRVPAVFVGHLKVSDVKPRGSLSGLSLPRVEATVTVDLTVRLLSTESGGTLWSNRARASDVVGQVGLAGGEIYFSAEDPGEAYGRLVDGLIYTVTDDLRPHWVKQ
jgi:hypothetical protein